MNSDANHTRLVFTFSTLSLICMLLALITIHCSRRLLLLFLHYYLGLICHLDLPPPPII